MRSGEWLSQRLQPVTCSILCLLLVSAVWVETDAYRLATLALVIWGAIAHRRADFKPSGGWMAYLCTAWILYVAARFIYVYQWGDTYSLGTSEGIYLLPIFYMTVGYTLFVCSETLLAVVLAFLCISLAVSATSVDFLTVQDGGYHKFLHMNNTIHSAIAGGLIILAAFNIAAYASRHIERPVHRWVIEAIAYATIAVCLVGVYGARSKGVWVAMLLALVVQFIVSVRLTFTAAVFIKGAVLLLAFVGFIWFFAVGNWSAIGPSFEGAEAVVLKALASGHPLSSMRDVIASGTVPLSTNERLILWHNAIETWSHDVVFGNGIAWLDLFREAHYKDVGFNVVHNGYLEIAMRYGFLGLAFYGLLYGWSVIMVRTATLRGLVPREAYRFHLVGLVFFFGTMLTNSNNRLAIGESAMIVAAAFGFYCYYLCQEQDWKLAQCDRRAIAAGAQKRRTRFGKV